MTTDWAKLYSELKYEERTLNSKVLLVDGMNTYIRCFAAVPSMNDDGAHVGGMAGFLKSVGATIRQQLPTRTIIVFDGKGGSQRRRKLFPEYKENRRTMDKLNRTYDFQTKNEESDSMKRQLIELLNVLRLLPVTVLAIENVEADDVIAYISTTITERKGESVIMSTDKDFLQLVNESVSVWNPIKKKLYRPDVVLAEYGIHPFNFLLYRVLDGDTSDNIPGVRGIGLKKLRKAIPQLALDQRWGAEELFDFSLTQKGKLFESIVDQQDLVKRNIELMRLDEVQMSSSTKLSVVHQIDDVVPTLDKFQLTKLFQEYKLWSSFPHYDEWLFGTFQTLTRFSLESPA